MIFGKHQVALGVLGMLIMGRALPVWAAETADGNVQEIVITANRMENKKVDTPANVSLVSSEDLTNWNSRSVADALENVPGVRVVRNGLGTNGANVYLNGEERVLSSWMAAASIPVWGIRRRGRPLMPIRCRLWI